MPVTPRLLRPLLQPRTSCRCQCGRRSLSFCASAVRASGHNRWSKISHDKAKVDAVRNRQRSVFSRDIQQASKLFGPDPNMNPRLADAISLAKKNAMPKSLIDAAIARGQGKSASGISLEPVVIEAMLPDSIAVVIDCQTDSKARTLQEVRHVIKAHGGNATPTSYLFQKRGRIVFDCKDGVGVDEVLEPALEAGALDVAEDEEGRVVLFTEPNETTAVGQAVVSQLGLQIEESEILWDPEAESTVKADSEAVQKLCLFVEAVKEKDSGVQGIYMNATQGDVPAELWEDLRSRVTA